MVFWQNKARLRYLRINDDEQNLQIASCVRRNNLCIEVQTKQVPFCNTKKSNIRCLSIYKYVCLRVCMWKQRR